MVILVLLASVVGPRVLGYLGSSRAKTAKVQIEALSASLELYKLDNFTYPTTDQGLEALVTKPSSPEPANWKDGGYLDRLPLDPWKQAYLYLSPGQHGSIDVFSLGPDQQPSEDDIGNWNLQ